MSDTGREFPARPMVGVGVVVLRARPAPSVLLIRRARAPSAGEWALPGGAQDVGETAEAAARRELLEETGLRVGPLMLAGHVDSIHRAADGRVRFHYTILDFCALWAGDDAVAGDDAGAVIWAALERLEELKLWDEAIRIIAISRRLLGV